MNTRREFVQRLSFGAAAVGTGCAGSRASEATGLDRPAWPPARPLDDEAYWQAVRAQYPLSDERGYMNTAGLGPAPYSVMDKYTSMLWDLQRISEHGHSNIEGVRDKVAAFVGVDPREIAFTRNATEGNATVASGLKLKAGDEVIFESHAHPGGAMAWMTRQKENGIKVRIFEPDPESVQSNLDRIEALITPRTKLIQVSHITAPTGILLPVDEIAKLAHARNIWFHIDGAQSAGAIPFSVSDIDCDSYATSCHKWMGAPHGTGFLFVKYDRLGEVVPTEVGAYSNSEYELPDVFDYVDSAQRYECGTRDVSSIVGIGASVDFLNSIGLERVRERGRYLARYLQSGLREIPGATVLSPNNDVLGAATTTVKVSSMPYDKLYSVLAKDFKLRCRIVSERGLNAVRVSTHIFNSPAECDRAIAGVKWAASRTSSDQ